MKKMNNRGFLLAESLVVSTFVLTVLILLFVQFKTLFNSYEDSYDYNTVEGIYNLNTMKKYIKSNIDASTLQGKVNNSGYLIIAKNGSCNIEIGFTSPSYCEQLVNSMNLNTVIYTNSNVSSLDTSGAIFSQTFKNFISRIENKDNQIRLIGQFKDGTYATIVYGEWKNPKEGE